MSTAKAGEDGAHGVAGRARAGMARQDARVRAVGAGALAELSAAVRRGQVAVFIRVELLAAETEVVFGDGGAGVLASGAAPGGDGPVGVGVLQGAGGPLLDARQVEHGPAAVAAPCRVGRADDVPADHALVLGRLELARKRRGEIVGLLLLLLFGCSFLLFVFLFALVISSDRSSSNIVWCCCCQPGLCAVLCDFWFRFLFLLFIRRLGCRFTLRSPSRRSLLLLL